MPEGNEDWISKGFITLLWISTTSPSPHCQLSEFDHFFTAVFTALKRSLCPEAAHGALVVREPHTLVRLILMDIITSCSGSVSRRILTMVDSKTQSGGVTLRHISSWRKQEILMWTRFNGSFIQDDVPHILTIVTGNWCNAILRLPILKLAKQLYRYFCKGRGRILSTIILPTASR